MRLHIERKIDAAHKLVGYDGPCKNLHGHTWKIEVDIYGSTNPDTGMVVDFRRVKDIIDELDHSYLNEIIDETKPTAENILLYLWDKIDGELNVENCTLSKLRVYESENSFVEHEQF